LSDFGELGDARNRSLRIAETADHLGGGTEQPLFDLVIPLGAGEFRFGISRSAYACHRAQSEVFIG
jgi:hypothetical protein